MMNLFLSQRNSCYYIRTRTGLGSVFRYSLVIGRITSRKKELSLAILCGYLELIIES